MSYKKEYISSLFYRKKFFPPQIYLRTTKYRERERLILPSLLEFLHQLPLPCLNFFLKILVNNFNFF